MSRRRGAADIGASGSGSADDTFGGNDDIDPRALADTEAAAAEIAAGLFSAGAASPSSSNRGGSDAGSSSSSPSHNSSGLIGGNSAGVGVDRDGSEVVKEIRGAGDSAETYMYRVTTHRAQLTRNETRAKVAALNMFGGASSRNGAPVWRAALTSLWVQWYGVFCSVFLPIGYPDSVTADYLTFQLWDTVQAMCSYLRGLLCTQAVLTGVGVGNAAATATSASLQWIVRDGTGMLGSVVFAWSRASSFGFEPKQWRMFADVINDLGLTVELLSPYFPNHFLPLLCVASVCRALCGVAAGASRAALMNHFAKRENVSDITAKEGIQETAVTLVGLVCGGAVTWWLDGHALGTWLLFAALTALHVYANYKGLSALVLTGLNRQRATILIDHYLQTEQVLTPAQVAARERIFWFGDRYDAWRTGSAPLRLGVSVHSVAPNAPALNALCHAYRQFNYFLAFSPAQHPNALCAVWHVKATARDVLTALFQAQLLRRGTSSSAALNYPDPSAAADDGVSKRFGLGLSAAKARATDLAMAKGDAEATRQVMARSVDVVSGAYFDVFYGGLEANGWDVTGLRVDLGEWRAEWSQTERREL